jgi:uncharacterized protein involved in exopolysaccharide biosynthesis/Mrp family chromosome partitioning ATPase
MKTMQPKTQNAHTGPSITIGDIYHVIFKRKWLILAFSLLGFAGAVGLCLLRPPSYASEAKLLIRYVEDRKTPTGMPGEANVSHPDSSAAGVLETEANILTSFDVAKEAADAVGVDKVLRTSPGDTNRDVAALVIRKGLNVDVPKRGNVLILTFEHPDKAVVQPVLRSIIQSYYKKHLESHRNAGVLDEFLTQETDQLRQSLAQTEEDIRKLKAKAGLIPLEDSRKIYSERYTKLRDELDAAEAELSERTEAVKVLQKAALAQGASEAAAQTNSTPEVKPKLPSDVINDYKRILARLDAAYKQQEILLSNFTEENSLVKANKGFIASLEVQKKEMESKNPTLRDEETTLAGPRIGDRHDNRPADLTVENARVAALQARVKTLTAQFERIKADAGAIDEIETKYAELQRKKQLQETQYIYYSRSLDQARTDSQLGAGKLSNISEIQAPSVPLRDSKKLKKALAGVLGGGIGGGLALAFLLELVLAQNVRRATDIESTFNVPVFLTIPQLEAAANYDPAHALTNGSRPALPAPGEGAENNNDGAAIPPGRNGALMRYNGSDGDVAPWDERHALHGYAEGLRDRLMTYFEVKGLKHKPKLVAITSCSKGAGVTTLAAGLAASLSETGEGNVLLVDLNMERGAAHPFYRGKPACGLADVLEGENRDEKQAAAKVNEHLYVVHGGESDERFSRVVPQRLAHLLPKLQQADYDYIIFDMPPITQTSVTPRLAGFMDMNFIVVEAEKTSRDWLKQATALLKHSNANVAAVFNKRREYAPRWLHQEF